MPNAKPVQRTLKQQAVLGAARSLFLKHGFSTATTDMIQREAGVSKATVYACFPTKEALFVEMIEQECAAMADQVRDIEMVPGNLAKTLMEIGKVYLGVVLSPSGMALYRVIAAESPRFPELGRRFFLAGPSIAAALTATQLSKSAQAGEIDVHAMGVDAAAALFMSMVRGQAQIEALTHPETRPSAAQVDYWVQLAVTTFLAAFGVKSQSGVNHV